VRELQAELRRGLETLSELGQWTLGWSDADPAVITPDVPAIWCLRVDGEAPRIRYVGRIRQVFLATAMDLVREWWPTMRRCEDEKCGAWFIPVRRQTFHTPQCSQRVRAVRFLERQRAASARRRGRDYHREHEKRNERRYGSKVKTKRKTKR
jgi:hypothetical protein